MPHQYKSQKCYLDLGINLEWPNLNFVLSADLSALNNNAGQGNKKFSSLSFALPDSSRNDPCITRF